MTDQDAATRTVVVEREFPFPPVKLWRALTQPHLIEEWLMKNDFDPVVGHRFHLRGEWGGALDCEVLSVEPYKMLSYTWNHVLSRHGPDRIMDVEGPSGAETVCKEGGVACVACSLVIASGAK